MPDRSTREEADEARNYWIFQSSPARYDLVEAASSFSPGDEDTWPVTRLRNEMAEGDSVALWSAGAAAGVYAIAEISGPLFDRPSSGYTHSTDEREWAAPIQITRVLDQPILRRDLLEDSVLKDLSVIRSPTGTNFRVTPSHWRSLMEWIDESGQAGTAAHLFLKWTADREPRTIELHREVAERQGSVWWGKFGRAQFSDGNMGLLQAQLDNGIPTHVYLYRSGETWQAELLEITKDRSQVDPRLIPSYYSADDCELFVRITDIRSVEDGWLEENATVTNNPDLDMREAVKQRTSVRLISLASHTNPTEEHKTTGKPMDLDELIRQTQWAKAELEELINAVTNSRQVVLAGPPGTSKTHVAKAVAAYLTGGDDTSSKLVQFHPSYGYEDFIEGLRPVVTDNGGMQFEIQRGVVREIVKDMEEGTAAAPFVLVIDEMNRANLPRVFGELMYLFEYREEKVNLQHTRSFALPKDLWFIGTMNTADRSIRAIDIALRRRFEVFECPPKATILRRYYDEHKGVNSVSSLVDGFESLNERLAREIDRHHTIGHTFFMDEAMNSGRLRRIWERKLEPLIEEYFFDRPDRAAGYRAEEFWPELAG